MKNPLKRIGHFSSNIRDPKELNGSLLYLGNVIFLNFDGVIVKFLDRFGDTEISYSIEEVPQYLFLHGECINAVMSDFITGT